LPEPIYDEVTTLQQCRIEVPTTQQQQCRVEVYLEWTGLVSCRLGQDCKTPSSIQLQCRVPHTATRNAQRDQHYVGLPAPASNVLAYRTKINTVLGPQHHESQLRPRPACSGVVVKMSLSRIDLSHIGATGTIVSFGSRKESDSQGRMEPMHLWRRKILC
jgi:hypothetical protein